jgi:hypothetical protein
MFTLDDSKKALSGLYCREYSQEVDLTFPNYLGTFLGHEGTFQEKTNLPT